MANEFIARKGLIALEDSQITGSLDVSGSLTIESSGSTLFEIIGSEGQLFAVTDNLSGSLFAVSDVSGLPILEVFSDDTVKIGTFNNEGLIVGGANVTASNNFLTEGTLTISGSGYPSLIVGNPPNPNYNIEIASGSYNTIRFASNTDNGGEHKIGFAGHTSATNMGAAIIGKATGASGIVDLYFSAGSGDANEADINNDKVMKISHNEVEIYQRVEAKNDSFTIGSSNGGDSILYLGQESKTGIARDYLGAGNAADFVIMTGGPSNTAISPSTHTRLRATKNGNIEISGSLTIDQGLEVTGSTNLGGTLTIPGFSDVSASLAAAVAGGDDLGNHTATQDLDMGGNAITNVGNVDGVDVSTLNSTVSTNTSNITTLTAATSSYLTTVDISDDTNLVGGTNLTLSGDTMNLDANISLTSITASGNISASGDITASNLFITDTATYNTVEFTNSNIMKFNQRYTGGANGTYFTNGEYQKVVTITPSAASENYQVVGRMTAQNAGETHTVYFNAALRSVTLTDLTWTINYDEEYNGVRYLDPQLWVKETATAGFVIAFKTLATIYGSVTIDFDVIPRAASQKANVTINQVVDSEQTSVDSGFTAYDMQRNLRNQNGNFTISGSLAIEGFNDVSASLAAAIAGGDDLGNHTATQDLNMGGNAITNVGNVDGVDVSTLKSDFDTLEGKTLFSSSNQVTGFVDTTGTPANNQLAIFTDSNTIEGDSDLTWDGSTFTINGTGSVDLLRVDDKLQGNGSGFQFFAFNEDTVKVKFANWYSSNDRQYGMGQLWYETWFAAIDNTAGRDNRRIGLYLEEPSHGASDADGGGGQHPNNARFYVDITGSYVASGGLHVTDANFNVESNGNVEVNGDITVTGTVDGVDIATLKGDFDTLEGKALVSGSYVASVNGQTGAATLNADDIGTTGTTNKFTTQADITKLSNLNISGAGDFVNNEFIVAVGTNAVTSSDALAVDSSGNLGIGTNSPEVRLHMRGEDAQTSQILMEQYNDTTDAPDIRTRRFRGTPAAPTDVQTGDYLFRVNVEGRDGGSNVTYGSMQFDVDGTDQDALNWRIQTRDTGGTLADRITIDSAGDLDVAGQLSINGFSDVSASLASIPEEAAQSISYARMSMSSAVLRGGASQQDFTSPTDVDVQFDTEDDVNGTDITTDTASYSMTVATTGYYRLTCNMSFHSTGARTTPGIRFNINGTNIPGESMGYIRAASGQNENTNNITRVIELTANDEITVCAHDESTVNTSIYAEEAIFEVEKLGGARGPAGPSGSGAVPDGTVSGSSQVDLGSASGTVDISSQTNLAVGNGITLTGDTLTVTAGTGLTQNAGGLSFDADGGTLTTNNTDVDHILINDGGTFKRITKGNINVGDFNNDVGYTTNTGTVTSVAAGTGLSGATITSTGTINVDYVGSGNVITAANTNGTSYSPDDDLILRYTESDEEVQKISITDFISGYSLSTATGVEDNADVTDSTNVQAAGALMDSEVTNLAQVKAFDSSDYATAAQGTLADTAIQPADTGSFLTTVDISSDTNLAGGTNLTLSGDTMNLDDDITLEASGHRQLKLAATSFGSASIVLQGNTTAGANKIDAINKNLELQRESSTIVEVASTGIDVTGTVDASVKLALNGVDAALNNAGTLVFGNVSNAVQIRSSGQISVGGGVDLSSGDLETTGNISGSNGKFTGTLEIQGIPNVSASIAAAGSGGGGGAVSAVANGANNRVATFSSTDALNGEANMTFDGSTLDVTGDIRATGDVIARYSSDATLKKNIETLKVNSSYLDINGVRFDWDEEKQKRYQGHDIGFIAQEIEQVFPEAVGTRHDGTKAVDYHKLIPPLWEMVKDLHNRLTKLENGRS